MKFYFLPCNVHNPPVLRPFNIQMLRGKKHGFAASLLCTAFPISVHINYSCFDTSEGKRRTALSELILQLQTLQQFIFEHPHPWLAW